MWHHVESSDPYYRECSSLFLGILGWSCFHSRESDEIASSVVQKPLERREPAETSPTKEEKKNKKKKRWMLLWWKMGRPQIVHCIILLLYELPLNNNCVERKKNYNDPFSLIASFRPCDTLAYRLEKCLYQYLVFAKQIEISLIASINIWTMRNWKFYSPKQCQMIRNCLLFWALLLNGIFGSVCKFFLASSSSWSSLKW